MKIKEAVKQFRYLFIELKRMNNIHWWRWFSCWFSEVFIVIASYRIERALYLIFGKFYSGIRIVLSPVSLLLRPWLGKCEIHYRADIGPGFIIYHPSLGVVINGSSIIGKYFTLSGGNCIGARRTLETGEILIGDNVTLGINAVVLGPIKIGDNVQISPCAIASNDIPDNHLLIAIPPRAIHSKPKE